jgi:hypothetical protein
MTLRAISAPAIAAVLGAGVVPALFSQARFRQWAHPVRLAVYGQAWTWEPTPRSRRTDSRMANVVLAV